LHFAFGQQQDIGFRMNDPHFDFHQIGFLKEIVLLAINEQQETHDEDAQCWKYQHLKQYRFDFLIFFAVAGKMHHMNYVVIVSN